MAGVRNLAFGDGYLYSNTFESIKLGVYTNKNGCDSHRSDEEFIRLLLLPLRGKKSKSLPKWVSDKN